MESPLLQQRYFKIATSCKLFRRHVPITNSTKEEAKHKETIIITIAAKIVLIKLTIESFREKAKREH